jgi:hypothetical protein
VSAFSQDSDKCADISALGRQSQTIKSQENQVLPAASAGAVHVADHRLLRIVEKLQDQRDPRMGNVDFAAVPMKPTS